MIWPSFGTTKIHWGRKVLGARSGSWCKNRMFLESWKRRIWASYVRCVHLSKFVAALPGDARWALAPPCGKDMVCGNDSFFVSRIVQAILLSEGAFAKCWSKRKSATWWHGVVHKFVSLDGFRWGFVNFELTHQRMIWSESWGPDNLLRAESCGSKVIFVVQNPMFLKSWKLWILENYARCVHLSGFFRPCRGLFAERTHPPCGWDMSCGDDSPFESKIAKAMLLSEGAFAKFWSKRKSATSCHVFVHIFGFGWWISVRFCLNLVKPSKDDMARALDPGKFIEDGKCSGKGRIRGAKIAWFWNLEHEEFWGIILAACFCHFFFGPAGRCSLSARIPLVVGI